MSEPQSVRSATVVQPNVAALPSTEQPDPAAEVLAANMEAALKRRFPEQHPRVIAYPLRRRVQLAWDTPDHCIETHWLAWGEDQSPEDVGLGFTLQAANVIAGSLRRYSTART